MSAETKQEPTPRPWKAHQGEDYIAIHSGLDGLGAEVLLDQNLTPEDAAHIVRCVNAHERLVEALGRLATWCDRFVLLDEIKPQAKEVLSIDIGLARAALSAARGEE